MNCHVITSAQPSASNDRSDAPQRVGRTGRRPATLPLHFPQYAARRVERVERLHELAVSTLTH